MKKIGKVVLHIPAREGSKRIPRKNLRKMNDSPMISYVIKESLESKITKEVYVNTDSSEIISYVGVSFFLSLEKPDLIIFNPSYFA